MYLNVLCCDRTATEYTEGTFHFIYFNPASHTCDFGYVKI